MEAFNREYVKTFTRKAAGALEALEEGLMRDPTSPHPTPRRISRVAPDSRSPREPLSSSCAWVGQQERTREGV